MALALYRKYRPKTFAEVIGQEHVTEPLAQALRSGRLHHAYLFSGPRGCGKTSSARILARSLNCERGPTPEPCGECDSCRALGPDGAGSIDVIEIDAASHGGVDDARDLRERAFFAPVGSRFKVYVIDEAHMVSTQGFNALLKLVEEPPDYVKFVFATTEPEKVLGTIRSRTHHYPFRLIPPGVLRPFLEQLCRTEDVFVEPAVFPLVVRAGAGSVRDSLSVLDQLIAGAGPDGVSYARAVALLGVTDSSLIDEMCEALVAADGAAAYATIDRLAEAGHDPRRFAADLLERIRDLIVLREVPDAGTKGLLDVPADQLERMAAQASRFGAATLSRFADIIHSGLADMRGATAPRLLLELMCARLLLPGADSSSSALSQRLEQLERRLESGAFPARVVAAPTGPASTGPAPTGPTPVVAAPAVETAPSTAVPDPASPSVDRIVNREEPLRAAETPRPAGQSHQAGEKSPGPIDAAAVRRMWDAVLTAVRDKSRKAAAVVREATVADVQGETLVLHFKHSVHATMLSSSPEILVEALGQLLGGRWQVRCETGAEPTRAQTRSAAMPSPAQSVPAKSSPVQPSPGPPDLAVSRPPVTSLAAAPAGGDEETAAWPATAVPGGGSRSQTASPSLAGEPPNPAKSSNQPAVQPGGEARSPSPAPARTAPLPAAESPAREMARAAARRAPDRAARSGSVQPPSVTGRDESALLGFAPGDEPMDDGDDQGSYESGEQQAIRLLTEAFGAERL